MKSPKHLATPRHKYLAAVFAVSATLGFSGSAYAYYTDEIVNATFSGKGQLSFDYKCSRTGIFSSHTLYVTRIKTNGDTVELDRFKFGRKSWRSFYKTYEFDQGQKIKVKVACSGNADGTIENLKLVRVL